MKEETPVDLSKLFQLLNNLEEMNEWIFRGHIDEAWTLETSFERMFNETGKKYSEAQEMEIGLIKKFQREAHYYGIPTFDYLNIPEWLSIMQHYGAPTRLLDWTHSPWIGAFFAIIDKKLSDKKNAAIYALNWKKLNSVSKKEILDIFYIDNNLMKIKNFTEVLKHGPGVIKLNSYKQNERQIIQQGTFLFPLSIEKIFQKNLEATALNSDDVLKIIIPADWKKDLIQKLYRMNITYATLYPGIGGFSMSLKHLHWIDKILSVEKNIKSKHYDGFKEKLE